MGYRGNDLLSFKLSLNNPSKLAELQELEHWKARFEAADGASAGYFSRRWVAKNILDINEEEFARMQVEMYYDRKHDFSLEQVGEAMAAESGGLGAMSDTPGEAGASMDLGATDDAETADDAIEPGPEAEDAETGPLLATPAAGPPEAGLDLPPAKRDIDEYGRSYSVNKGKRYYHKNRDDRNGKKLAIHGLAGIGKRDTHPGKRDIDELINTSYSFSENLKSNYYDDQEEKLLNENNEIKKLIQSLETSKNEV